MEAGSVGEILLQRTGVVTKVEETRKETRNEKMHITGYKNIRTCSAEFQVGKNEWEKDTVRFRHPSLGVGDAVRIIVMRQPDLSTEAVAQAIEQAESPVFTSEDGAI